MVALQMVHIRSAVQIVNAFYITPYITTSRLFFMQARLSLQMEDSAKTK